MDANDPILVDKVRQRLIEEMSKHPEEYDSYDTDRVRTSDWTIARFLHINKLDVESAFTQAREAMKWRKEYGLNQKTDSDFPEEFYKIGMIFPYAEDKEGREVIYLRIKLYKSFPKFADYFKQFFIHIINKVDIKNNEKGFVMIWDMTGAGPSNWDLSMVRFVIHSLRQYFPGGLNYLLIYGCPWIMMTFVNIALSFLPAESKQKVRFANKDKIMDYIHEQNIPDFLNGKCEQSYREVPEGVGNCLDMGVERGYSLQEIENVLKYYENELK